MPKVDLRGKVYSSWTILAPAIVDGKVDAWLCRCHCGTEKSIKNISTILNGKSKSCGCKRKALLISDNPMFRDDVVAKVSKAIKADPNRTSIIAKASTLANTPEAVEKRKATNLKRYGGSTPMASEAVKHKVRTTTSQRYGVEHAAQSEQVKQDLKEYMVDKYGVANIMLLNSYKELVSSKVKATLRAKGIEKLPNGEIAVDECNKMGVLPTTYRNWRRAMGADYAQMKLYSERTPWRSSLEKSFLDNVGSVLISLGFTVAPFNKKVQQELSYKPDFKVSFNGKVLYVDVDGLFWHGVHDEEGEFKKEYHMVKAQQYKDAGYTLLQFRESELGNHDLLAGMIAYRLGYSKAAVNARDCDIKPVPGDTAKAFLMSNHLMGSINGATHIGLFAGDNLVSLISYRMSKGVLDISRFCNKRYTSVRGGFSKLLSHVVTSTQAKSITNYVDLRYNSGNSSAISGFTLEGVHLGFQWTDGKHTFSRHACKADSSRGLSEKQVADEMGLYKIYDAGQAKFTKILIP